MAQNYELEPQVDDSLPVNLENDCLSEQPTADFSDDSLMV